MSEFTSNYQRKKKIVFTLLRWEFDLAEDQWRLHRNFDHFLHKFEHFVTFLKRKKNKIKWPFNLQILSRLKFPWSVCLILIWSKKKSFQSTRFFRSNLSPFIFLIKYWRRHNKSLLTNLQDKQRKKTRRERENLFIIGLCWTGDECKRFHSFTVVTFNCCFFFFFFDCFGRKCSLVTNNIYDNIDV